MQPHTHTHTPPPPPNNTDRQGDTLIHTCAYSELWIPSVFNLSKNVLSLGTILSAEKEWGIINASNCYCCLTSGSCIWFQNMAEYNLNITSIIYSPQQSLCAWHLALSLQHAPLQSASAFPRHQNACTTWQAWSSLLGFESGWNESVNQNRHSQENSQHNYTVRSNKGPERILKPEWMANSCPDTPVKPVLEYASMIAVWELH